MAFMAPAQAYDVERYSNDNTIYVLLVNDNPGAVFHSISISTPTTLPSFLSQAAVTVVPDSVVGGGSGLAALEFNVSLGLVGTSEDLVLNVSGLAAGAAINFDIIVPLTIVANGAAAGAQGQIGTGIPVPDLGGVDSDNDGISDALEVAFGSDPQESTSTPSEPNDADFDGIADSNDNCPAVANADQADADNDGAGDVCDSTPNGDDDADGVDNNIDNCPAIPNADQADADNDGAGDVCDSTPNGDDDVDGVDNNIDNCPAIPNANQTDTDADGTGDACDSTPNGDADSDGVDNNVDNCPTDANADQLDSDTDGSGDACDATPFGDEVSEEFIPIMPAFAFGLLALLLAAAGLPLKRIKASK